MIKTETDDEICNRVIELVIVGERCVYINNSRIEGSKPYASENLPHQHKETTVAKVLGAFSIREIEAYLATQSANRQKNIMEVANILVDDFETTIGNDK